MAELAPAGKSERLVSLDVFRGITIAGMVLVNNPGTWDHMFWPLDHAEWDGWTPTDFIFPFFLFIVGVAMTFSFDKRLAAGADRVAMFAQVVRRTIILFLLGMIMAGFPNFRLITPYILTIVGTEFLFANLPVFGFTGGAATRNKVIGLGLLAVALIWFFGDFSHFNAPTRVVRGFHYMFPGSNELPMTEGKLANGKYIRVPGVLQRIALAYFFASIVMLVFRVRGRIATLFAILAGYWLIMRFVPAPGGYTIVPTPENADVPNFAKIIRDAHEEAPYPGFLNDWIDVKLLGWHLYGNRPDPEGILSTIPSIGTVIFGILTGTYLLSPDDRPKKTATMYTWGVVLLFIGYLMHQFFPINKKIWSSSFVVFMSGWALVFFAFSYFMLDVKGWKKWSTPFAVFGTNAILVFFGSGMMARLMGMIRVSEPGADGTPGLIGLNTWIYKHLFLNPIAGGAGNVADLAEVYHKLASCLYSIAFILLWLVITYPLYRKKIFLKV